jgi:hypothetical protein
MSWSPGSFVAGMVVASLIWNFGYYLMLIAEKKK